ncbi:MAG: hypothetical protein U0837_03320 [Dehalococcoidia bacterium]|jgi:hypothetical protein
MWLLPETVVWVFALTPIVALLVALAFFLLGADEVVLKSVGLEVRRRPPSNRAGRFLPPRSK